MKSLALTFSVALLITGNLIGAGILGLPINAGISGLVPSLLAMLVFGGAMLYSAWVLADEAIATRQDDFNYPSLYRRHLGYVGKWVAILANLLILYGLLTAYLAGGTAIVVNLLALPSSWAPTVVLLALFAVLTALNLLGESVIRSYNLALMILLWLTFAVLVAVGETKVETTRLLHEDWRLLPLAVPIIVTAFHFHNIIPDICRTLEWNRSAIWRAMVAGMIIGYLMNAVWIQVGIGSIPLEAGPDSLVNAYHHNLPATVPMAHLFHSRTFTVGAMLFALLAITTSYIANGMGLLGFNRDLLGNFLGIRSRSVVVAVTFAPPLIIALLDPDIFLKAIDLVGGVGIVILFGILPGIIALAKARRSHHRFGKYLAIIVLIMFSLVLTYQIAARAGWWEITVPAAEEATASPQPARHQLPEEAS